MLTEEERQIVLNNLKLVDYILHHKFNIHQNNPYYDDYQQEGRYGLMLASQRFDESTGTKFSTFACMYIEGYIKRYRRDYIYGQIKYSRNLKDLVSRVAKMYYEGCTYEEIKLKLNITEQEYSDILSILNISSINAELGYDKEGKSLTLQDYIGCEDKNLLDFLGEERVIECIERVASNIKRIEHKNIWYEYIYPAYFGEKITNQVLATKYNISQPHINRLLNKYKQQLRSYLSE